MADFETFECANCGAEFKADPSAQAASTGYCSPACETEGKGLA